jgi:hypothetical protein
MRSLLSDDTERLRAAVLVASHAGITALIRGAASACGCAS